MVYNEYDYGKMGRKQRQYKYLVERVTKSTYEIQIAIEGNHYCFYCFNIKKPKNNILTLKHMLDVLNRLNTPYSKHCYDIINSIGGEKNNINSTGTILEKNKQVYVDVYNCNIIECIVNTEYAVIELEILDMKKRIPTLGDVNPDLKILNGNCSDPVVCEYYGVEVWKVWTLLHGRDMHTTAVSLDIETGMLNNEYQCISYSLGSNTQAWFIASSEIQTNDTVINSFMNVICDIARETKTKQKDGSIKSSKHIDVDVHNLSFDGSYIVTWLLKNGFVHIEDTPKNDLEFNVLFACGILQIVCKMRGVLIKFMDTFRLMSTSLSNISNGFKNGTNLIIEKSETATDYNKVRTVGEKYKYYDMVYCFNDVVVLSFIRKYFNNILVGECKLTSSACALSEYVLSMRYGCFNTDTLVYAIQNIMQGKFPKAKPITENNWRSLCVAKAESNGFIRYYLKDYYNEHKELNIIDYESFCNAINSYVFTVPVNEMFKTARSYGVVLNYLISIKHWNFDYALNYCLYNYNHGQNDLKLGKGKRGTNYFKECYEYYFPKLMPEDDKFIRQAYFGGLTCVNPDYLGIRVSNINGASVDINSSYPDKMKHYSMPYGVFSVWNCGDYGTPQNTEYINKLNEIFNDTEKYTTDYCVLLHIQGSAKIKKNKIALFINKSFSSGGGQIYNSDYIDRYITLQEFLLAQRVYDMNVNVPSFVIWNASKNLFRAYYERYYTLKSSLKGTALYDIVKVLLNGLYGKFGENIYNKLSEVTTPVIDTDGNLHFKTVRKELTEDEIQDADSKYLPVAVFTTSNARCQLIEQCSNIADNGGTVLYTDTDSIYFMADSIQVDGNKQLLINDKSTGMIIDKTILGQWDLEHTFTEFVAYAPKRYGYIDRENKTHIKCAGISKKYTEHFTLEDLEYNTKHVTLQSKMDLNGRHIQETDKVLGYKYNIYKCSDGLSHFSETRCNIGDTVITTYHEKKIISEILLEV